MWGVYRLWYIWHSTISSKYLSSPCTDLRGWEAAGLPPANLCCSRQPIRRKMDWNNSSCKNPRPKPQQGAATKESEPSSLIRPKCPNLELAVVNSERCVLSWLLPRDQSNLSVTIKLKNTDRLTWAHVSSSAQNQRPISSRFHCYTFVSLFYFWFDVFVFLQLSQKNNNEICYLSS